MIRVCPAALLRGQGIDAVHVGEIGMSAAEDATILRKAKEDARIVATLDAERNLRTERL